MVPMARRLNRSQRSSCRRIALVTRTLGHPVRDDRVRHRGGAASLVRQLATNAALSARSRTDVSLFQYKVFAGLNRSTDR